MTADCIPRLHTTPLRNWVCAKGSGAFRASLVYAPDNAVYVQDQVYNQPHEGKFSHEALAVSLRLIWFCSALP